MDDFSDRAWLTLPEVADRLGLPVSRVRRLLEERHLLAIRRAGVLCVPEDFVDGAEPLGDLRGTIILLSDSGYTDEEAMRWLLTPEESLGVEPTSAIRAGRKAEVRRIAQALAF